jgi:hypothetical protein
LARRAVHRAGRQHRANTDLTLGRQLLLLGATMLTLRVLFFFTTKTRRHEGFFYRETVEFIES